MLPPKVHKQLAGLNFSKNDLDEIADMNRHLLEILLPKSILPMPPSRLTMSGIELCECFDCQKGIFVLYVSAGFGDSFFYPQLAHEILHIVNPYLYDWYIEGLCNVFSENICRGNGLSWESMKSHFRHEAAKDPYAISYFMMRQIFDISGEYMQTFFSYAVWSDEKKTKMHIDIDSWLATLPEEMREEIRRVINTSKSRLLKYQGNRNNFIVPSR